jgi:hypothetical protein
VRGLSIPRPQQLALPLREEDQPLPTVWEALPSRAQEEALRILARAIARLLAAKEADR